MAPAGSWRSRLGLGVLSLGRGLHEVEKETLGEMGFQEQFWEYALIWSASIS